MRIILRMVLALAILLLLVMPTVLASAQEPATINDIPIEGVTGPNNTPQQQDAPALEGISTYDDEQEVQRSFRNFILGGLGLLAVIILPIIIIVIVVIILAVRSKKKKQE